jgi:HAD superfamily, subfamily IIIB (Acid phosphatase)
MKRSRLDNGTGRKYILCDIDGTLADIEHRRHLLTIEPRDWPAFFERMVHDKPNLPIVNLYKTIWESGRYSCILVTGRPEKYRNATLCWLSSNGILFESLLMRSDGDKRPDYVVKLEMLEKLRQSGASVEFVIDDRRSVVEMWRGNGVVCLQCADPVD